MRVWEFELGSGYPPAPLLQAMFLEVTKDRKQLSAIDWILLFLFQGVYGFL